MEKLIKAITEYLDGSVFLALYNGISLKNLKAHLEHEKIEYPSNDELKKIIVKEYANGVDAINFVGDEKDKKGVEIKPLDIDKMGEKMRADQRNEIPVVKDGYRGGLHDIKYKGDQ